MAAAGEAVVVDGLATRVQRPREWANQKVLYDAKRRTHSAQGLSLSSVHGDLLWVDGAGLAVATSRSCWPCQGWTRCWTPAEVATILDRGFPGMARPREHRHAPVRDRRTKDRLTGGQRAFTACRRACVRWWSRRSAIWPMPGRCAAGRGCCTASGTSSGPLVRSCAWAAGCTEFPSERALPTPQSRSPPRRPRPSRAGDAHPGADQAGRPRPAPPPGRRGRTGTQGGHRRVRRPSRASSGRIQHWPSLPGASAPTRQPKPSAGGCDLAGRSARCVCLAVLAVTAPRRRSARGGCGSAPPGYRARRLGRGLRWRAAATGWCWRDRR